MKKIVFYYKSMNRFGGVERVIANTMNELSSFYDITILTKDSVKCNFNLNSSIDIVTLNIMQENSKNRSIKNILKSTIKLKEYLKCNSFDYIYTATIIESLEVFLTGKENVSKLVATEHGSFFASNQIYLLLKKIIFPKIHKLIAFTTLDFDEYKKLNFPTVYIPHLVINNENVYNIDRKEHIVLNVGRLTSDKRQNELIMMWNSLVKSNNVQNWKLVIVGSGELEQDLKNLVKDNNLYNYIEIHESTSHIEEYYKKASIFAFTSKMEGFGMVLVEAMSYAVPCISFDCPSGPRDIICDGENGFLIPNNDYDKYQSKLLYLMKNESLRTMMGKKAIENIQSWDNKKIIEEMKKVFE